MPLQTSKFNPPAWLKNSHWQTIYSNVFRKIDSQWQENQWVDTPDGDELYLDFSFPKNSTSCLVLSHGFEGDSNRPYILGLAKLAYAKGLGVVGWNMRGCGPRMNRKTHFYHSGMWQDLSTVVEWIVNQNFKTIYPVGFSLGGNLTLNFMAEAAKEIQEVKAGAAISVPCHLAHSSQKINHWVNTIYKWRFLYSLQKKITSKGKLFPEVTWQRVTSIRDFDHAYTAPWHGYTSAEDYYQQNSSLFKLQDIHKPSYLISASDDSFISHSSLPYKEAYNNPHFFFEDTISGGHCGFYPKNYKGHLYSEVRVMDFLEELG